MQNAYNPKPIYHNLGVILFYTLLCSFLYFFNSVFYICMLLALLHLYWTISFVNYNTLKFWQCEKPELQDQWDNNNVPLIMVWDDKTM